MFYITRSTCIRDKIDLAGVTWNLADRGGAMRFYDFFFSRRVCSRSESVQSSGGCAVRLKYGQESVQLGGECAVRFGCVHSARRVCSEVFS